MPASLDGTVGIQREKAPENLGMAAGIHCSTSSPLLKWAQKFSSCPETNCLLSPPAFITLASMSQNVLLGLPASDSLRELVNSANFWPLLQTPESLAVKLGRSTFNKLAKLENHCPK